MNDDRQVTLGGQQWTVPPLSLRQVLGIATHIPKLAGITADNMSGERLEPLCEVVRIGLQKAHPELTRDQFYDMHITINELIAALPVVVEQGGGKKLDGAAGEPSAAGTT